MAKKIWRSNTFLLLCDACCCHLCITCVVARTPVKCMPSVQRVVK